MIQIEKQPYGFRLTFEGQVGKNEIAKWIEDSEKLLADTSGSFGVFVDLRTLKPLFVDAQQEVKRGQVIYRTKGMQRSVVILNDIVATMQFRRIARETGIDKWERYIDASTYANWEALGIGWVQDGREP